ncbi:MAG: U32 family peptidase [Deltaproteobacteria bacterium]|nr:U32 family peptidase [Deltaproteobacteria bacterium]
MTVKRECLKPEILAPAGDKVSLQAALDAGCDAVYLGIRGMNMRAGAKNFTLASLPGICSRCHARGVRVYLALNTVVFERERKKIAQIIAGAGSAGIDAVICSDYAVIQAAHLQGVPVHISTQMSVANAQGVLFFYQHFQVRRFVLARECSLNDIVRIRRELTLRLGAQAAEIEIEVFVHGAMCVSVSGRCFMSLLQYGKSANRGECLQPCRREYRAAAVDEDVSFVLGNNYVMSPRDLCALPILERLIRAGVASFKIEGRNRSPEYVATATAAYRRAVDYYCANHKKNGFHKSFAALKEDLVQELARVYHRGFSTGFYLGKPMDAWSGTSGSVATTRKEYAGVVQKYFRKAGVAEVRVESNPFAVGDEIMFQGPTSGTFSQEVVSIEIEHRRVSKASKGMVVAVKTTGRVRTNDRVYLVKGLRRKK